MAPTSKSIHDALYRDLLVRLRAARESAGLTQDHVAAAVGMTQSQYSKIERCERRLDVLEFVQVAQASQVDPAKLLRDCLAHSDERVRLSSKRRRS